LDGGSHDLSFGPKGVNKGVVLDDKSENKKGKPKAGEEEFFGVGENEAKSKYSGERDSHRLEEGQGGQLVIQCPVSCKNPVLFNGPDKDTVKCGNGDLSDEHQHTKNQCVCFRNCHDSY
jgi:hypothetical protein